MNVRLIVMWRNSIHFGLELFGKIVTFKRITKFKHKKDFYTKYGITLIGLFY